MTNHTRYFGKYRGTVANNVDPMQLGRIQAAVPDISGPTVAIWAMPCFPVAGMFLVPPVGSGVWIEFEQGDPDQPIWTGCFYESAAQVPPSAQDAPAGAPLLSIHTPTGNGITITDEPDGGLVLSSSTGATVRVNETGIHIDNGLGARITLLGPAVDVNNGALSVV